MKSEVYASSYPADPGSCILLHRDKGTSETGPRIGGSPPVGVTPQKVVRSPRYLLTFPISTNPALEASVFYSGEAFENVIEVPDNVLVARRDGFIETIVHGPSRRAGRSKWRSPISDNPLVLSRRSRDADKIDGGPRAVHKLGGRPYLLRHNRSLQERIAALERKGVVHVLQLAFIVGEDAEWDGPWPFLDGLFHLFSKPPYSQWRWLWQY
jgi:hypothetical protein